MVCVPNGAPRCGDCPLKELCLANAHGTWEAYPVKDAKKQKREEEKTVFYLICEDCLAVRKRESRGLLGRAVGASERGGKARRGAGAMLCGRCRMRAGGVAEKRRACACVHAYHLAHALLLYGMQAKIAGICLGRCAKTARGCGAADGVPDVCRGIKSSPRRAFCAGNFCICAISRCSAAPQNSFEAARRWGWCRSWCRCCKTRRRRDRSSPCRSDRRELSSLHRFACI